MLTRFISLSAATLFVALMPAVLSERLLAGNLGLPDPKPPFALGEKARQKYVLKTVNAIDKNDKPGIQPYFESGGKQIFFNWDTWRDFFKQPAFFTVFSEKQPVARVTLSGWIPDAGKDGTPFMGKYGANGEIKADLTSQTVTFTKEFLYNKDQGTSKFIYTMRNIGDGKMQLDWDLGLTQKQADALPPRSDLRFDFYVEGAYTDAGFTLNNEPVVMEPEDFFKDNPGSKMLANSPSGGVIQIGAKDSADGFSVEASSDYHISVEESYGKQVPKPQRAIVIRIGTNKLMAKGFLIFDLGPTSVTAADAPSPVAGVDFWKSDRMHIPLLPTRNLMSNPSFEQGLRYWTWRIRGGTSEYKPEDNAMPCYELSDDAKFGHHSLKINATFGNRSLDTLVIPVVSGENYTISFYTKGAGLSVGWVPALPVPGEWESYTKFISVPPSKDWARTSFTIKAKIPAERLEIEGLGECWVDGVQIEKGTTATDFVLPKVEGWLTTSDPDNSVQKGSPLDLNLRLSGEANLTGKADLKVLNYYREVLYKQTIDFKLDAQGTQKIPIPLTSEQVGTGIFVARIDYSTGDKATKYTDYYRFSVLKFLSNTHPTKNLFGLQSNAGFITRGDDLGEMYKRWGWGSNVYNRGEVSAEFLKKHGISTMLNQGTPWAFGPENLAQPLKDIFFSWEEMTPEREKIVEEVAYKAAMNPKESGDVWAFNTESDGHTKMALMNRYDQFITLQMAARRGFLRANPNAKVLPDGGTSGFKPGRGYDEMEKQLKASQGRVKWDGLAIHPYGSLDDMDESIQHLVDLDAKYNPGANTPLYVPEVSPGMQTNVPEWAKISQYYDDTSCRPTYDTGWQEYLITAWSARLYLIGLKYWPRLQDENQWLFRPFIDLYFAPIMMCGSTNTLGNFLGEPKFIGDFQPVSEVKGLIFEDENKCGLAAIWSNSPRAEEGVIKAPEVKIKLDRQVLEFIDLMGNVRTPVVKNDEITIPLTIAPLFIKTLPGKSAALVNCLNEAEVTGSGNVLSFSVLPTAEGAIAATITNQTRSKLGGELEMKGKKATFDLEGKAVLEMKLSEAKEPAFGKMYQWNEILKLNVANGFQATYPEDLAYFYIPKAAAPLPLDASSPLWSNVPSQSVTNFYKGENVVGGHPGDLTAEYKLAWDKDNLYLRVQCKDDKFLANLEAWKANVKNSEELWKYDGSVEVYFDTFANARSKSQKGYDKDDYRYDFYAKDGSAQSGGCAVYRQEEVFLEYAGGPSMPTKQDVKNGGIKSQFSRTGNDYSYVMIFPQKYLTPFTLQAGYRVGFALFIHDYDIPDQGKGLSMATKEGEQCFMRPDLWPIMILSDKTVPEKEAAK